MPWHLSKSDPRKIYDETHDMVCVCRTNEQAAMVVQAVNRYRQPDMIGYPAATAVKPDLAQLRDEAQGTSTADSSFAVVNRRH